MTLSKDESGQEDADGKGDLTGSGEPDRPGAA